jgi:murein DD-endopeptidase MepM/ murein hydrolase activator NlpD
MEKNPMLKKVYAIMLILLGFNLIALLSSTTTNANVTMVTENNSDNIIWKSKYIKLNYELLNLEKKINEMSEYNNQVYFQIMGVDTDAIEIPEHLNNIKTISSDSIFKNLDERSMKASQLMSSQINKLVIISKNLKNNTNLADCYPTISPIKTGDFQEISAGYGWRKHPYYKKPVFHQGVDICAQYRSTILSTMNGYVSKIVYSGYGYGNKIIIKNAQGFEILYAHMSTITVKKGQFIKKGQSVGTVGSSGLSTGAHLHYEVRKNDKLKDPLAYFYTYLTDNLIASNENSN